MANWKSVVGFEGAYQVSECGQVKSLRSNPYRILKPGKSTKQGHLSVTLGRGNKRFVHRLVAEAFLGPIPPKHEVLHLNGLAGDNRVSNLRYGTRSENNIDISLHGKRKITVLEAREIKAFIRSDKNAKYLAQKLSISKSLVWRIWYGKVWVHA